MSVDPTRPLDNRSCYLSSARAGEKWWQTAVQSCAHLLWYVPVYLLSHGFTEGALP